jgi:O-antigen ligase
VTVGYGLDFSDSELAEAELGGKQLLSGRQVLWPIVLAAAAERPISGHGLGRVPGEELPDEVSSHNGFLQIFFQEGAIGVGAYLMLFILIFGRALSFEDPRERVASVGVLCAALVCETFEVILTQNHFGIGLVFWILASTTIRGSTARSDDTPDPASGGLEHCPSSAGRSPR